MDRDHNGVITKEEWQGSARSFQVHDWNGDGQLSGAEVRIGAQRNANWEEADHNPNSVERYVSWTTSGFNNLDHNRDRKITRNEWHYDTEMFRRVDRNGDGALDRSEFLGEAWDDDDRSGTIARNEWHGSVASFNRRDLNRDGVLSRREFDEFAVTGTAGASTTLSGAGSQYVRVNAQQRWNDTGLDVRAGDTITFDASGTIQMSDNGDDVATPAGSRSGRRAPDAPIINQPAGALLARIGGYGPIFVGDRRSIVAPVSGRLYLGVNDDHLPDNRGEFAVNVGIQRR